MNKARIAKRKKHKRRKRESLWAALLLTAAAVAFEVAYQAAKK